MFEFSTLADRSGIGNLKHSLLPDSLKSRGVIGFAGAEMDFRTAPVIIEALTRLVQRGLFGYTLPDERYLRAVVWWMQQARGMEITQKEIVPTLGTMFSLGTAIRAFTRPGDGIIIQHPGYYRYEARVLSNRRKVVSAPLAVSAGAYRIDRSLLEELAARQENRMLILCNPHNPTGKVYSPEELEEIGRLARRYDLLVFSDEIFGEITFAGHTALPFADICPERTVMCTSLGKVFNLTGVNQANVIIRNPKLREAFVDQRFMDHFGSIDPFFYTALTAGYSPEGLAWVIEMRNYVWENYLLVKRFLEDHLQPLAVAPLEGSFIIWIDLRQLGLVGEELDAFLIDKALLAVDCGSEYGPGGEGFIRMNIASPRKHLEAALEHLCTACEAAGLLPEHTTRKEHRP